MFSSMSSGFEYHDSFPDTLMVVTDTTLIGKLTENNPKSMDSASRNIAKNMSYRNHDEVMILY